MIGKTVVIGTALCVALAGSASAASRHKYSSRESAAQEVAETQALNRQQAASPGADTVSATSDVKSPATVQKSMPKGAAAADQATQVSPLNGGTANAPASSNSMNNSGAPAPDVPAGQNSDQL